ncbi:MAG: tail fiber domain-containing protein, partial [Kofleriaceae bacterium]|nr:tail fiber domain-containing protein [Candidatus Methylomirabilis lanthanidiphila]
NTTGYNNTALGWSTLNTNTIGANNTALGQNALLSNTVGNGNIALGSNALYTNTAGSGNVAMGRGALRAGTGSVNIGIGSQAGLNLTSGDNNIYLGSPGPDSEGAESNTLRLGDPAVQTSAFMAGVSGAVVPGGQTVVIDASGRLGVLPSSARYKRDIAALGIRSHELFQLRPVSFRYKDDPAGRAQYGLIAEEVATLYPELVTRTATGEVLGVDYPQLIPLLLNELQVLKAEHQQAQDRHRQDVVALKADHEQELALLKAQQDSLRAELLQIRAALAPQTAALR